MKLLVLDPLKRMTAKEALNHEWIKQETASSIDLLPHVKAKFNAKRTFKKAVCGYRVVVSLGGSCFSSSEIVDCGSFKRTSLITITFS